MFKPGLRYHLVLRVVAIFLYAFAMTACGVPAPDPSTAQGKAQILFDVNSDLNVSDCPDALNEITPLYNSTNTDNTVRMAMASVYACFAGFNFFDFISKASSAGASLATPGALFDLLAQEFPSNSPADKVVESAGDGIDALMASLNPGEVLIANDLINTTTTNEGSLLYTDRTTDSNSYLFFVSLAAMGGEENRQGATAAGKPTGNPPLQWTAYNDPEMSTDGIAYASALVNFADAVASIPDSSASTSPPPSPTNVLAFIAYILNKATSLANGGASFAQTIDQACVAGCTNSQPGPGFLNANAKWVLNTCGGVNTGCSACPLLLRYRFNSSGTTGDGTSCAAAGVINFVNSSAMAWQ